MVVCSSVVNGVAFKTLSNRLVVRQSPFGSCVRASRNGLARAASLAPPCMPHAHAIAASPAKVA